MFTQIKLSLPRLRVSLTSFEITSASGSAISSGPCGAFASEQLMSVRDRVRGGFSNKTFFMGFKDQVLVDFRFLSQFVRYSKNIKINKIQKIYIKQKCYNKQIKYQNILIWKALLKLMPQSEWAHSLKMFELFCCNNVHNN